MQFNTVKRALLSATMLAASAGAFLAPLQAQGIGQRQCQEATRAAMRRRRQQPFVERQQTAETRETLRQSRWLSNQVAPGLIAHSPPA